MLAAVETGGTKVFCAVARRDDPETLIDTIRIDTTTPEVTLGAVNAFLLAHHRDDPIDAVGVASFGPLETRPESAEYGWITTTPKPGWANTDLRRALIGLDNVPVAFVTDVTGSLLGERRLGAARGLNEAAYTTVGTGVGVGVISGGALVTGHGTPELGHFYPRRHPDDTFAGNCRFHGDCIEGLAAGPAVHARWGRPARGSEVDIIAFYVAQLCVAITLTIAPARLVVGGGVAKTAGFFGSLREQARILVAGYLGDDHPIEKPDSGFIVPPALGDMAGIHGALDLAESLLR